MQIVTVVCNGHPLQVECKDFVGLLKLRGLCVDDYGECARVKVDGEPYEFSTDKIMERVHKASFILMPEHTGTKLSKGLFSDVRKLNLVFQEKMNSLFEEKHIVEMELEEEQEVLEKVKRKITKVEEQFGTAKFQDNSLYELHKITKMCYARIEMIENILHSLTVYLNSVLEG